MAADDVFTLLEGIPSDVDSISTDDDQEDPENITANNNNLLDLNDIPIIFADDLDLDQNIANQEDDDSIDSDPEMNETLAVIRSRELAKRTIWTTSIENCVQNKKTFSEATGASIPDDLESPHDVFLHIFPLTLIETIVFQTNLYALQKNGGNPNSFTATNAREMKTFLGINILMVSDVVEKELGARVVKDLSRDLVGKGHHIYFDNFFNSVQLQKDLQADLIYACGTVRTNRKGLPADMKSDKDLTQRGDFDWRVSKDGLVFVKWKDRKIVSFLSNYQNPLEICSIPRKEKDGSSKDIRCPNIVRDYNAHMGYVDKMDMLKSIYEIDRKSKKVSVATGLIGAGQPARSRAQLKVTNHFKRTVPYEISNTQDPHRTRWTCSTCDVGLCLNDKKNCFQYPGALAFSFYLLARSFQLLAFSC
ncbi:hypothetical protein NQ314_014508 [Rhamnusium bicolor]|uniref:PiggyBac transposable element-derived protein domain-containing protein n=1 Tax=Rhamnusium bicolor TaxID=1586634 RepID=A0AAV8X240_9CUCU|nr:hypothetical protein NQ314_014508 [Rhamnusium bicolor]